jgi:hypothetical protein
MIIAIPISSVSAGGPRLDYGDDVTNEEADCWVDGFDAGFAGKYDEDRANECKELGTETGSDQYNSAWGYACKDAGYIPDECESFKNNPVDIEDHESLEQENAQNCWNDRYEDGKADTPFNRDRASGCSEYGDKYRDAYKSGCQSDSTESSCELLIQGHKSYCPSHPDNSQTSRISEVDKGIIRRNQNGNCYCSGSTYSTWSNSTLSNRGGV